MDENEGLKGAVKCSRSWTVTRFRQLEIVGELWLLVSDQSDKFNTQSDRQLLAPSVHISTPIGTYILASVDDGLNVCDFLRHRITSVAGTDDVNILTGGHFTSE